MTDNLAPTRKILLARQSPPDGALRVVEGPLAGLTRDLLETQRTLAAQTHHDAWNFCDFRRLLPPSLQRKNGIPSAYQQMVHTLLDPRAPAADVLASVPGVRAAQGEFWVTSRTPLLRLRTRMEALLAKALPDNARLLIKLQDDCVIDDALHCVVFLVVFMARYGGTAVAQALLAESGLGELRPSQLRKTMDDRYLEPTRLCAIMEDLPGAHVAWRSVADKRGPLVAQHAFVWDVSENQVLSKSFTHAYQRIRRCDQRCAVLARQALAIETALALPRTGLDA